MPSDDTQKELGLNKSRIEALTDGIFAIGMTLLILDLKIEKAEAQLATALFHLWPKFLTYVTSFFVLGIYWIAHRGYTHFLKRTDRWYLWMNLLFLMVVVLVPFSTDVLGDYPFNRLALVIYGLNIDALGITLYLQWHYASDKHRLVSHDLEPEVISKGKKRIKIGLFLYTTAILLALYNPLLSLILYVIIPFGYIFPSTIDIHWTHGHD